MGEHNQRNNGPHELSPKVPEEVLRISISVIAPAMRKRCNLFPDMATSQPGRGFLLRSYWSKLQIGGIVVPRYHIAFYVCVGQIL
jgi:hypothetical protein